MYCDLWPYVWLINESGFKSRAAYDGARTVFIYRKILTPLCNSLMILRNSRKLPVKLFFIQGGSSTNRKDKADDHWGDMNVGAKMIR